MVSMRILLLAAAAGAALTACDQGQDAQTDAADAAAPAAAAAAAGAGSGLVATPISGQGMTAVRTGFSGPESVYVVPGAGYAIVSNTNSANSRGAPPGSPPEPGFLSTMDLNGQVQELHWVDDERFRGVTGMRSFENTLWVANGIEIASVDIAARAVTGVYPCPGARFINDIATGPDGTVYGSESFSAGIYMIAPGATECTWFIEGATPPPPPPPGGPGAGGPGAAGPGGPAPAAPAGPPPAPSPLQTLNGLYGAPDALMVATIPGRILAVDYATKEITVLGEGLGSFDGIEPYGDGTWLLSDTRGKLVRFDGTTIEVLNDSSDSGFGANDMAWDPDTGTALIARLNLNAVTLYRVGPAQ